MLTRRRLLASLPWPLLAGGPVCAAAPAWLHIGPASHEWPWQPGQWLDLTALNAHLDAHPDTGLHAEVDPLHRCLLLDLVRSRGAHLIDDTPIRLVAWFAPHRLNWRP